MNALRETRIIDEGAAFDEAKTVIAAELDVNKQVRSLQERLNLARELEAKGQVKLFEAEIKRVQRAFMVDHMNPYPEVTRDMAMDAMCGPIKKDQRDDETMQKLAPSGTFEGTSLLRALLYSQLSPGHTISIPRLGQGYNQNWYGRGTHKYDLEQATVMMPGLGIEGATESEVLLPMSALCRLKEAKEKDIFDHFQVWRPTEYKAPDPWLVGVYRAGLKWRYFKICDWR